MLLSLFSTLYEFFCGQNPDSPEYREGIFAAVGVLTFIISVVVCFIFYIAIGRWKNIWNTRTHWFITIIICGGIGFLLAYSQAKSDLASVDGYLIRFALINAVYAGIYFIVFSFLFKNFSIFCKRTPL